MEDVVDRLDAARAVGWYRPDDTRRILRIVLPMMLPMAIGASVVGVAYTQLKAIDPMGIEASVHPPPPRGGPFGSAGSAADGLVSRDDTFSTESAGSAADFFEPGPSATTRDAYARAHGGLAPRVEGVVRDGVLRGPYRRAPAPPVRDATIPIHVWLLFALGFLLVAAGPTSIILGLGRTWKDDLYLLLRVDALIHQTRDGRHHVAWDQVARVEHDAGVVRLRMRDESSPYEIRERFAGIDPPALAARLEEVRRKASFGLLR
ncbi:MAG: hypothetical protein MUE69_23415 [Myxococcota bacterium]|nr:hypothetical protein [Myxococcota bacterium]